MPGPAVTIHRPSELNAASWTIAPCPLRSHAHTSGPRVPDTGVVVGARGHDERSVGTEPRRRQPVAMPDEDVLEAARRDIPDPRLPVHAGRHQMIAVGTERQIDGPAARAERPLSRAVCDTPQDDSLGPCRRQAPTVRAERNCFGGLSRANDESRPTAGTPDAYGAVGRGRRDEAAVCAEARVADPAHRKCPGGGASLPDSRDAVSVGRHEPPAVAEQRRDR